VRPSGARSTADDKSWYSHAIAAERPGFVVGRFGRRDVVEEAAVLVVGDHEHRLLPAGTPTQRVIEVEHELLAGEHV